LYQTFGHIIQLLAILIGKNFTNRLMFSEDVAKSLAYIVLWLLYDIILILLHYITSWLHLFIRLY